MGFFDALAQLLGGKPASKTTGQAAAPSVAEAATTEDWQALCMAFGQAMMVDDVEGLWGEVRLALEQPAAYLDRFADKLVNRGMVQPEHVTPWLALVEGLQWRGQNQELDWKLAMDEAIWVLQQLKTVQRRALPLQVLVGSTALSHDALMEAGDYLHSQGLTLVSVDVESDCYPLSVVETSAVVHLQALARKVGGKLVTLHN